MDRLPRCFDCLPEWLWNMLNTLWEILSAIALLALISLVGAGIVFLLGALAAPVILGFFIVLGLATIASIIHALWEDYTSLKRDGEKQKELDSAVLERDGRVYSRKNSHKSFRVEGPPQFIAAVDGLLTQLRERTPQRYEEVITYLPKAVYDPSILSIPAHGLADGRFAIDGTDPFFRFVFLHEVGHNVHGKQFDDWSENAANAYAHTVLQEFGS